MLTPILPQRSQRKAGGTVFVTANDILLVVAGIAAPTKGAVEIVVPAQRPNSVSTTDTRISFSLSMTFWIEIEKPPVDQTFGFLRRFLAVEAAGILGPLKYLAFTEPYAALLANAQEVASPRGFEPRSHP
jgi:hypothetical protein